ncbi:hypothetical protein MTR_8g032720 [Medicago truncatula]|uniref:Uncharacterized protein n=1 Tax=Medicago truncatula TaxID=3880 RepID=A0A072TP63_MEDTR|nr:hypothetical protein MTR_8g032720 [Medicago truncatula]
MITILLVHGLITQNWILLQPPSIYELIRIYGANYGEISANNLDGDLKWDIDLILER